MQCDIVVTDLETYYAVDYSLSHMSTEEYIRDPRFEFITASVMGPDKELRVYDTEAAYVAAMRQYDWSKTALLAHHTAFDGAILNWRYGIRAAFYLDTMSMAQPHYGFTTGVSLGKLAEQLTAGRKGDEVIQAKGKHRADFTPEELRQYGRYCAKDMYLCWCIYNTLLPATSAKELALIDQELRCFIEPWLVLDQPLLQEYNQQVKDLKQSNYVWASNLLGCTPEQVKDTIMSNDKLAKLLEELGVAPPQKISPTTGKMAYAFAKTDDEFLALKEHEDEAVQMLVTCRLGGKSTLAETRSERLIEVSKRGLLPVYLKHCAAHTGRLGGGDMLNLQNLTRGSELKKALRAPPNHKVGAGDLSQIEARVLGVVAGQRDVTGAFKAYDAGVGPDIYCVTASAYTGRPITRADKKERQLGKVIRLALGYGMGVPKFIITAKKDGVILSPQQADQVHKWYRDNNEYIVRFWRAADTALKKLIAGEEWTFGADDCIVVKADGLHLPSGRVLRYPGLRDEGKGDWGQPQYSYLNRKKRVKVYGAKVVENICQSLAGSVTADAWLRVSRKPVRVVLQVHDELVIGMHDDHAESAMQWLHEAMTAPVKWLPELPVACEVGYAEAYGLIEKKLWKPS